MARLHSRPQPHRALLSLVSLQLLSGRARAHSEPLAEEASPALVRLPRARVTLEAQTLLEVLQALLEVLPSGNQQALDSPPLGLGVRARALLLHSHNRRRSGQPQQPGGGGFGGGGFGAPAQMNPTQTAGFSSQMKANPSAWQPRR